MATRTEEADELRTLQDLNRTLERRLKRLEVERTKLIPVEEVHLHLDRLAVPRLDRAGAPLPLAERFAIFGRRTGCC